MDEKDFKKYLDYCYERLERKQKALMEKFSLGTFEKFELDLDKGEIYFLRDGKIRIQAGIVPIGSFNSESQIWMWAWANENYPANLCAKSSILKMLKGKTGIDMFEDKMANIDEPMAWEVVSMSVEILESEGVYRSSADKTQYFLAVKDVSRINS